MFIKFEFPRVFHRLKRARLNSNWEKNSNSKISIYRIEITVKAPLAHQHQSMFVSKLN